MAVNTTPQLHDFADFEEFVAHYSGYLEDTDIRNRKQLVSDFNKHLFSLINIYKNRLPQNGDIRHLIDLMSTGKQYDHEILINEAGWYLFECFEDIIRKNINSFNIQRLETFFEDDMAENDKEFVRTLFGVIYEEFHNLTTQEQQDMFRQIHETVNEYILYNIRKETEEKS